jgi:phosphatidylinositol glycan class B
LTPRARDLAPALGLAAFVQLVCARALGGRLHPDETHQYLEVAHRLVWGYGTTPHEWRSGMRNLALPGLLTGLLRVARALGLDDPRGYIGLVHVLVGALSLTVVTAAYDLTLARTDDRPRARLAALVLALWTPWQNLAFRTLGETFSTIALCLALALHARSPRRDVLVGVVVALAFVARYPAGLYLIPFAFAYAHARDLRGLARWSLGVALVLLGLGALDALTWGRPWHSVLAYADYNLLRDRARIDYGARPVWFYLLCLPGLAPVVYLAASVRGAQWRRGALPLGVAVTYLAAMSALAHKEPRFFLPVIPLLVIAAACVAPAWSSLRRGVVLALCVAHSLIALAVYERSGVCEGDAVRAAEWVGRQRHVSAVLLLGVSHPGYAHLHRDVPVLGDARNDARRALATFEARQVHGATWAICLRRTGACEGLVTRGWGRVKDFGGVVVLVRRGAAVAHGDRTPRAVAAARGTLAG